MTGLVVVTGAYQGLEGGYDLTSLWVCDILVSECSFFGSILLCFLDDPWSYYENDVRRSFLRGELPYKSYLGLCRTGICDQTWQCN